MEITKLSDKSLRLKGKKATFLIDVIDIKKTEANAYVYLTEDSMKASFDKGKLLISGSGDYEVMGTKISATKVGDDLFFEIIIDGIKMLLANASAVAKVKDKIDEQQLVLLHADSLIDQTAITNLQPSVVVSYGEKATEVSTALGKGLGKKDAEEEGASADADIKPTDKFAITAEKLPAELQVVLLK